MCGHEYDSEPLRLGIVPTRQPEPTRESVEDSFTRTHILPVPWMEPVDVSRAIWYLVGESGRYITASTLTIDAGFVVKS
jgi:NAD(P)-dependent dehydrogenase (short-subunit alcohol dehydrogenase family)